MFIFTILFFVGKLHLYYILDYYETNVYKSGKIYDSSIHQLTIFYSIPDIMNIIFAVILVFNFKVPKINNSGLESGLMSVESEIN